MKPFTIRPIHWYQRLSPSWWRRKRIAEAMLEYEWEKHRPDIEKAIENALLYGEATLDGKTMQEIIRGRQSPDLSD